MANEYESAVRVKHELDKFVRGQDEGTKRIALAVAEHIQRLAYNQAHPDAPIKKENILVVGPTGCGKTETFRCLRGLNADMQVPIVMKPANSYAPTKTWKGTPLETIFEALLKEAEKIYREVNGESVCDLPEICFDLEAENEAVKERKQRILEMAQHGIVMLDEFDKLTMTRDSSSSFGYDYQSTLLKMCEGEEYVMEMEDGSTQTFDTSDVMFIFVGAFAGLEKVMEERDREMAQEKKQTQEEPALCRPIGFMRESEVVARPDPVAKTEAAQAASVAADTEHREPTADDIVAYGFLPELLGRIPLIAVYHELSVDLLCEIMRVCDTSAYKNMQHKFQAKGHELVCDDDALREIATRARDLHKGARALESIFSNLLYMTLDELSDVQEPMLCRLTAADVRAGRGPSLEKKPKRKGGIICARGKAAV